MQKTYYDILQVAPTASFAEIKQAYRALVKKYHPDASGNENNTHLFFDIQIAYETLSNPTQRQAYHYKYFFTAYKEADALQVQNLINNLTNLLSLLQVLNVNAINYGLLHYQLEQSIHAKFTLLIHKETNRAVIEEYIQKGILCIRFLPYKKAIPFYTELLAIVKEKNVNSNIITKPQMQHQQYFYWHRYKIVFVVIAVIVFCCFIYYLQ